MEHDIVAYLYPHNDNRKRASKAIEANSRYAPPTLQSPEDRYSRSERASTEPLVGGSALDYLPCLVIKFSDVPRTDKGLVFGYNSNCDVIISHHSISNVHFSLTFDDHCRPIIRDLNSLVGTQVTYDGRGKGTRREFQWIIGSHKTPMEMESIIITIPNAISFQIKVPFHDVTSPAYINKVDKFKQGTATAEGLLGDLGLSLPPTRPDTGANTPGAGEIQLKRRLGGGSFGTVTHLWNVCTGDECVVKEPNPETEKVDKDAWRQEARIMGLVSHPHIVHLIKADFTRQPRLYLEYVPGGTLGAHEDISYGETVAIISQCTSALAYLHGSETPVVHRDIKPENILVQYRFDGDIYVKLADFGLSKEKTKLMTLCGSQMYVAPEVYSEASRRVNGRRGRGFTPAVDIWSLGVVACQITCGLPRWRANRYGNDGSAWCKKILTRLEEALQKIPSDLGQFLLDAMVVLDPERRLSADECNRLVLDLPSTKTRFFHSSGLAPRFRDEDQTASRYTMHNYDAGDLSTIICQPRSTETATSSYFVRSGAPPPRSVLSLSEATRNYDKSEVSSSSDVGPYANYNEGNELGHFAEDFSSNLLHPLYVGTSLASQLGGHESQEWASGFTLESTQYSQGIAAKPQTCRGPVLDENVDALGADDFEELAQAARLLQSLGQHVR